MYFEEFLMRLINFMENQNIVAPDGGRWNVESTLKPFEVGSTYWNA
jgi:hypothetical protein